MSNGASSSDRTLYLAATTHTLWDMFTDIATMQAIVQLGNERVQEATLGTAEYLIGSEDKKEEPRILKPMHPCYLEADCPTPETSQNLFAVIHQDDKMELQFGTLVFLSVDAESRERVASLSPPAAADLARNIPSILEKALMGTPSNSAQPPIEIILRFTNEIERVYSKKN